MLQDRVDNARWIDPDALGSRPCTGNISLVQCSDCLSAFDNLLNDVRHVNCVFNLKLSIFFYLNICFYDLLFLPLFKFIVVSIRLVFRLILVFCSGYEDTYHSIICSVCNPYPLFLFCRIFWYLQTSAACWEMLTVLSLLLEVNCELTDYILTEILTHLISPFAFRLMIRPLLLGFAQRFVTFVVIVPVVVARSGKMAMMYLKWETNTLNFLVAFNCFFIIQGCILSPPYISLYLFVQLIYFLVFIP